MTLEQAQALATQGKLVVLDLRPSYITLSQPERQAAVARIINQISVHPLDDEDMANAQLLAKYWNEFPDALDVIEKLVSVVARLDEQNEFRFIRKQVAEWLAKARQVPDMP